MGPLIGIVDDDATFREVVREILLDEGYQVVVWPRTTEVIAFVRAERPRLLLLDAHLGGQASGDTVLEALRADPSLATLPVILCTADAYLVSQHAERLRRLGCHVLAKPFDVDDLLGLIGTALHPPEATDPPGR
jgi:CheY-like chemotaxis protein